MSSQIVAVIVASLLSQALPPSTSSRGVISVLVMDQQGKPVSAAKVRFDSPGLGILHAIPECTTDASGSCSRRNLAAGAYTVTALKLSDGYPDTSFEFYSHQTKALEVNLSTDNPNRSVVLKLGPRNAKISVDVVDDRSGDSINDRTIMLRGSRSKSDVVWLGKTLDSNILIPPDEDIQMEVTADGYRTWQLSEHPEVKLGRAIFLRAGELRQMTVRMIRK